MLFSVGLFSIGGNGLGLCEEAELEAQIFSLAQMFIRIPNVQFSTEPAFLQNPCWLSVIYYFFQFFVKVVVSKVYEKQIIFCSCQTCINKFVK